LEVFCQSLMPPKGRRRKYWMPPVGRESMPLRWQRGATLVRGQT
jgi:hypothetical protein